MKYQLVGIVVILAFSLPFLHVFGFYRMYETWVINKLQRAGLKEKYFTIGTTTLHYWIGGQGQPLLMLHGFGADAKLQWHEQVRPLSKDHLLIVPDLIYFGGSTSGSGNYSLEFQIDTMRQLLAHLNIEKFSVMGLSYGGMLAFMLAQSEPERVEKLIIVDSPLLADMHQYQDALHQLGANSFEDLLLPNEPELIQTLLGLAFYDPPTVPAFILRDVHRHLFSEQVEEKRQLIHYLTSNSENLRPTEWQLSQPVLLVWGRYDPLIPLETGERAEKALGERTQLFVIDKAAHCPNLEHPDQFNPKVLDFLRS
jgi:pimeloyl-ACP methyl ester carboxylesterase